MPLMTLLSAGALQAAPANDPASRSAVADAASGEARQADRVLRALRQRQQGNGVWQATALRPLEDFRALHQELEAQRPKAVVALVHASRAAHPDHELAQTALAHLEAGETAPAVALLARWEEDALHRAGAHRTAAEMARHQGALLAGWDATDALAAYQRAARHESGSTRTLLVMADLNSYVQAAVPSAGLLSTQPAGRLSEVPGDALGLGRAALQAKVQEGNALMQDRQPAAALAAYRDALTLANTLQADLSLGAASSPELQRDLSILHNRTGDALAQLGQARESLAAYRLALQLRERLAGGATPTPQSQRDLVQSLQRVGDTLAQQGQTADAARHFDKAVSAAQRLVRQQPALPDAQRDLATALERSGDLRLQTRQVAAARTALTQALAMRETLAATDPANRTWQRELSMSLDLASEALQAANDRTGALDAARRSLAVRQNLAAADTANPGPQRDLSVSYNRLGDVLTASSEHGVAAQAYREALRLRQALVERDPARPQALRDLSVSHAKLAEVLALQGDQAGALAALQTALSLRETLAAREDGNLQSQGDLALALGKMSTAAQLPIQDRQAYLSRGQAIIDRIQRQGPTAASDNWAAWFEAQKRLLDTPRPDRSPATAANTAPTPSLARFR